MTFLSKFIIQKKDSLLEKKSIILEIKVKTKSNKNQIISVNEKGLLKVEIKDCPKNNKANISLVKLLSKTFTTDKKNIKIISGKTSSLKLVKINI